MAKEKTPITIDDVEYEYSEMTAEQQMLVNHLVDLDRKINSSKFNLDQLQIGRNAFMGMLKDSLSKVEDAVESPQ